MKIVKMFVKCNCREVDITKYDHLHREAEAGCLFCGRCKTVMVFRREP